MKKRTMIGLILAGFAALAFIATPTAAISGQKRDNPNSGICKSGTHVNDIKKCKENGGTK
jgi:hypothetical protein